jgi:hypothetical protein
MHGADSLSKRTQPEANAAQSPEGDRRYGDRRTIGDISTVRGPDDIAHDIVVMDLAAGGCSFRSNHFFALGTRVTVGLAGSGAVPGVIIRHDQDRQVCVFFSALDNGRFGDAFSGQGPLAIDFGPLPTPSLERKPQHKKWPPAMRVVFAVGTSALLWALILKLL